MIPVIFLAAIAQTATPQPAESDDKADIVVIARQLAAWRGEGRLRGEVWECQTLVSTSDPEIDAIGCNAMEMCFRAARPQLEAIGNSSLRRLERRRARNTVISETVGPCVRDTRDEGVAELAAQRSDQ